jgi:hypothetical protein
MKLCKFWLGFEAISSSELETWRCAIELKEWWVGG